MKLIVTVNDKPLSEITLEERKMLDIQMAAAFKEYFGLIIPIYDEDYLSNDEVHKKN